MRIFNMEKVILKKIIDVRKRDFLLRVKQLSPNPIDMSILRNLPREFCAFLQADFSHLTANAKSRPAAIVGLI